MKTLYYAAIIILSGLIAVFFYLNKYIAPQKKPITVPDIGAIQILNGCGEKGAASRVGDLLRSRGFDVKDIANAPDWNYKETIVASRTNTMKIAQMVANALNTNNIIQLNNRSKMFDVTVFVGKDYLILTHNKE